MKNSQILNKKNLPLVFIPARGGSKRIKNKNIKKLGKNPLIHYPIENAKQLGFEVIVSTDSAEIASYSYSKNASVHNRPKNISKDSSTVEEAIKHYLKKNQNNLNSEQIIIILSACSPFLKSETIGKALKIFAKSSIDCLFSTHESYADYWVVSENNLKRIRKDEPRRQQDRKPFFIENSSFYITRVSNLLSKKYLIDGINKNYNISSIEGFDINDNSDFLIAEFIQKNLSKFL